MAKPPPSLNGRTRARQSWLKRFLPQTLFGRSFLILLMPLVLVQLVATWIFYDRLWESIANRLANGVAGDISMIVAAHQLDHDNHGLLETTAELTELPTTFLPKVDLTPSRVRMRYAIVTPPLMRALRGHLKQPFGIHRKREQNALLVEVKVPDGTLQIMVPIDRLWTSTTYIFLLWMSGTAVLTLIVATLFLRNQIRALRRLAVAADAFGKGRDVVNFRLEGATEIRQAAAAFLKMQERIKRQISQRTEMLAGVSHDLRTPLTRMKLELELLGDGEEITELQADVREMERMVEGYLDFVRGEGTEQPQVTNLVELINGAIANARRAGAEISLSAPAEYHLSLRPDAFRRCLANLINNATRHGQHVWVTALPDQAAIDVTVDDDGPGIPEEHHEDVFRPFFRLEGSRNPATGGTGLGLTIARDIIRGHGGELTLETSPQGGLRARLHLPR